MPYLQETSFYADQKFLNYLHCFAPKKIIKKQNSIVDVLDDRIFILLPL